MSVVHLDRILVEQVALNLLHFENLSDVVEVYLVAVVPCWLDHHFERTYFLILLLLVFRVVVLNGHIWLLFGHVVVGGNTRQALTQDAFGLLAVEFLVVDLNVDRSLSVLGLLNKVE